MLKTKHFLLYCFLLLVFSPFGLAQKEVKVILNIYPIDAIVKIDDQVFDLGQMGPQPSVQLAPTAHTIEVWAPGRITYRDVLPLTEKDSVIVFNQNISKDYTNDYSLYQEEVKKYRSKQVARWGMIGLLAVGNIWYNSRLLPQRKEILDRQEQLDRTYNQYLNVNNQEGARVLYENYARDYDDFESDRKRHNNFIIAAIPLFVGSAFLSFRLVKTIKKKKANAPGPFEEQSPFSSLRWQSPSLGNASNAPGQFHFVLQF